jgi:transcriptional regulator with XRE-family HTH domain
MSADPFVRFDRAVLEETTGTRIARVREQRGWTPEEMARRCHRSASWVKKVENGTHVLDRLSTIHAVAVVLGIDPLALVHTALRDLTR